MKKTILGLDLGTNSIGWALIKQDFENKQGEILGMGSRIIPMDAAIMGKFAEGSSVSQTAERTFARSVRRLRERHLLRRERLHRVLNVLGFLPEHFSNQIDFTKRFGKFISETEPKLAWKKNEKGEFEFLFQSSFNEMAREFNGLKITYDWTIYYLRKKALTQKIEKEELAWIILNFNQKRGYYQLRGEEEEENPNKSVEFYSLKIVEVIADASSNNKGETWYSLKLENGWVYRRSSKTPLFDWKDKVRDFIVTTDLNDDGSVKTDKDGEEKRSFRAPKEDDWTLLKKKTEQEIEQSLKTVGTYIYEALLKNPNQKIKGKLVRTIERKFYKEELKQILEKQIELQPELFNTDKYSDCVRELYRNNEAHQQLLNNKNSFLHLFLEDIIFYQRPLRSQKSLIGNCSLENRLLKDKAGKAKRDKDGKEIRQKMKVIPKSNPYYQEFRVWQWLHNLKIYRKEDDIDVTLEFLQTTEDWANLFAFLMSKKEVDHKDLFKYLFKELKGKVQTAEIAKYRWNYVYDIETDTSKAYPCNETGYEIRRRLEKVEAIPADFLTQEIEHQLWHLIYSVTDKIDYEKALKSFAFKYNLNAISFLENFKNFKPFPSEYGSFSEKAIKKLLPLMRLGKFWNFEAIDPATQQRIEKLQTAEFDENIKNRVREQIRKGNLEKNEDFQGLPIWLAQYIVYDRHSEADIAGQWKSISDLEEYLKNFRQHSLRNPIVEQVITETLRVVKDIWRHYGKGAENFFNEIHIELGREMKHTAKERNRLNKIVTENENTNLRIKSLLMELMEDNTVENVRPHSPMQQEILKIYEDGVLNSNITIDDEILKISKKSEPTKAELHRYKLWLEQKYRSPYTGQIIPLSKLFTPAYEIEHIIPQSRYFDDSFSNKVICEAAVNKLKDRQLGLEFIKNYHGTKVQTGLDTVEILSEENYKDFVKEHYSKNKSKREKLLMEEIPDTMIARQMNDTRYISKLVSSILSNIVRADNDDDGVNSKNIIQGNGKITTTLKQDWGLNDAWNELILPRFERMNTITNSLDFTSKNKQGHIIPAIPFELSKGFQKKRIDHRHHAMDALVIACVTRDHVNLLNNQSAKTETTRYDLQNKLRNKEKWLGKDGKEHYKFTDFKKPWDNFHSDAKNELERIVVSFKQNLRVINKATNRYEKIENGKKVKVEQKGTNWAIRKSLHKATVSGKVDLQRIKVPKGKILTATRKNIDSSFDLKAIESITDTGIQKILKNYLREKGSPEAAFSPEGIEDMNKNIVQYNDGKPHQPIYKVRIFELGSKFALGLQGNKKDKFVEADKGTNLFFAIYQDENGKRSFETIPLNIVIERQKQGLNPVPETSEKGNKLIFHLSPNDLVYVSEQGENVSTIDFNNLRADQIRRIYKTVSFSGSQCFFVKQEVASPVVNKLGYSEYSTLNKMERAIDEIMIKEVCVKLKVDRLGNISKA